MTEESVFRIKSLPENLKKEASILYELGLEIFEIEFVIHKKIKEEARLKWES